MAQIYTLEAAKDPLCGGFLAIFPSGLKKTVVWRHRFPLPRANTLEESKGIAARLLDELLREGKVDDADRTNWTSFVAAVQKLLITWSDKRRAAISSPIEADAPQALGLDPKH